MKTPEALRKTPKLFLLAIFFCLLHGHDTIADREMSTTMQNVPVVGVFPLKIVSPNTDDLVISDFENGLGRLLVERIGERGTIEGRLLEWPNRATDGTLG